MTVKPLTEAQKIGLLRRELSGLLDRMENYPKFPKVEQRIYIENGREVLRKIRPA